MDIRAPLLYPLPEVGDAIPGYRMKAIRASLTPSDDFLEPFLDRFGSLRVDSQYNRQREKHSQR